MSTTNGGGPSTASCSGDFEALDVRQADVEEDELGSEGSGGFEAGQAVGRFTDDLEPLGREESACLNAEARAVIDDEDGVHGRIVTGPLVRIYRVSPDIRDDFTRPACRRQACP